MAIRDSIVGAIQSGQTAVGSALTGGGAAVMESGRGAVPLLEDLRKISRENEGNTERLTNVLRSMFAFDKTRFNRERDQQRENDKESLRAPTDGAGGGGGLSGARELIVDSLSQAGSALKDGPVRESIVKGLLANALNIGPSNIGVNNLVSRTTDQVLNPNLELLFKGVILRQFNYNFTLTPRSREEGLAVKGIINTFKKRMAAKSSASNNAGAGLFIG